MSKTVKITENELVDLIDKIVNETVSVKKKQWIAEQKAKNSNLLESKIAKLEAKVKQVIKEESDPYNGKIEKILTDIQQLKSPITNKPPKTFVRDGFIYLSAEDGNYFADYYGEYKEDVYIDPRLEKIADKYGMYWDWESPGTIILGY